MYKAHIEGNAAFETLVPSFWDAQAASWMLPSSLCPFQGSSLAAVGSQRGLVCQRRKSRAQAGVKSLGDL